MAQNKKDQQGTQKPSSPRNQNQKQPNQLNAYLKYSGLAFQMLAAIGLAVWGGMKLDAWLGLRFPVFLIVFSLLAVVATTVLTIKSLPKE